MEIYIFPFACLHNELHSEFFVVIKDFLFVIYLILLEQKEPENVLCTTMKGKVLFALSFLTFCCLSLSLTFLILLFLSKCFLEASFYFFSPLPPLLFHCYLPLSGNLINRNVTGIFTNSLKFSGCFAAWPLAHRFHF